MQKRTTASIFRPMLPGSGRLIALAVFGMLLSVVVWVWQPGAPIYTDPGKVFYVPDPDLEWKLVEAGRFSLGADLLAFCFLCFAISGALSQIDKTAVRRFAWTLAACAGLPAYTTIVFGQFPEGARLDAPGGLVIAPEGIEGGLEGFYASVWVSAEAGRGVVAKVPAGGEAFETRFDLSTPAELRGDPSNLRQPIKLRVEAASASADTGVDARSKSARQYLQAEDFPAIAFTLEELSGARVVEPTKVEFAAAGTLDFMGKAHETPLTGTLKSLDAAARQRLGVEAEMAFLVQTQFSLLIEQTALKAKASSFDGEAIEIHVELVFIPKYS